MNYREIIRINAAGLPGNHGSSAGDYKSFTSEAGIGSDGAPGESASRPSPGSSARDVQVRLYYNESSPATVQLAGEGPWSGKVYSVTRDQVVHLDCKGGDGGRGGRGQDGQSGGMGMKGRDATQYRGGEKGGTGGRGGNGGQGTSGADGGNGGNVLLSVGEDDLDLLIAYTWDTSGGAGGVSGMHGMPGPGGSGGRGGASYSWTERRGDHTYHYNNPAGAAGDQGRPGDQPATYLSGGKNGREGSTQIRVLRKDLTEATYPGRYDLEVVGFDVLDENGDGINEPGEHLIVHNIKVKNKGQMPSPDVVNPITVLIHGTKWLKPVETEPLTIPARVSPGEVVTVAGRLRAFIRNESSPRAPGEVLREQDEISLIAMFNHRLQRTLPGFSGSTKYLISYPLELTPPRFLESVEKGARVRFSWTLRNVSRKVQGYAITSPRYTATRFSDPGGVFELPYSDGENPHEAVDMLEELQPGEEVPIEQDFIVSMSALEYSDAQLRLELLFGDPNRQGSDGASSVRTIMTYNMNLQVASVYKYNPASRFLLIVNSRTPNWAIHQILRFVRSELRLGLDIYNISLTGSLKNTENRGSVLQRYRGKSIITYGNAFPYFDKGMKWPWQMMDSWEVNSLARSWTGFLWCGVGDEHSLKQWASHIALSGHFNEKEALAVESLEAVIESSKLNVSTNGALEGAPFPFMSKHTCMDKFFGCCSTSSPFIRAQRAVKEIEPLAPLQRFMVVSDEHDPCEDMPTLVVVDGLPKTAMLAFSTLALNYNTEFKLSDHLKYAIIATLPFSDLVRIFWNSWATPVVGPDGAPAYQMMTAYAGLEWHQTQGLHWDDHVLPSKIVSFICFAIESQVGIEIAHFLTGKVKGRNTLSRLPKLHCLLEVAESVTSRLSVRPDQLMLKTLGAVLGVLLNTGLSKWISILAPAVKRNLNAQVTRKLDSVVKNICEADVATVVYQSILEEANKTRDEIKEKGGSKQLASILLARQAELTKVNTGVLNLVALNPGSMAMTTAMLNGMRHNHDTKATVRDVDEKHAAAVLAMHVNPDLEEDE